MRLPDPAQKRRRHLPDLLRDIPDLTLRVDSFEQGVQPPPGNDSYYSGKKKQDRLKSQLAVDSVDVSASVAGPTADSKRLEGSGLLEQLPEAGGLGGDWTYLKVAKMRRQGFAPPATRQRAPGSGCDLQPGFLAVSDGGRTDHWASQTLSKCNSQRPPSSPSARCAGGGSGQSVAAFCSNMTLLDGERAFLLTL